MNLDGYTPGAVDVDELPIEDRWILSRLATTTKAVTEQLEGYHFSEVARTIYDFTWSEFCDWYIEMAKGRLKDPAGTAGRAARAGRRARRHPAAGAAGDAVRGRVDLAGAERGRARARPADAREGRRRAWCIAPWPSYPAAWQRRGDGDALRPDAGAGARRARGAQPLQVDDKTPLDVIVQLLARRWPPTSSALAPFITPLAGVGKLDVRAGRGQAEAGRRRRCTPSSRRTCRWPG